MASYPIVGRHDLAKTISRSRGLWYNDSGMAKRPQLRAVSKSPNPTAAGSRSSVQKPQLPKTTSIDDMSTGETVIGLIGLAVLAAVLYGIWSIFWIGRPASFLSVASIFGWALLVGSTKLVEEIYPNHDDIKIKVATGLLGDAAKAALWTGIGLVFVWAFQLVLDYLPHLIEPKRALDIQLTTYDVADHLKVYFRPKQFSRIVAATFCLSVLIGAIWPINAAAFLKRALSSAAAIMIAFSTMTFVTLQTGSSRYQDVAIAPIQAKIGEDLEALRKARQEHAALKWLQAALQEQTQPSSEDRSAWHHYLGGAAMICNINEQQFEAGYRDVGGVRRMETKYCDADEYLSGLALKRLRTPVIDEAVSVHVDRWLPEFVQFGLSEPDETEFGTVNVARVPRRLVDLRALAGRVNKAAKDEEKARDTALSAVTSIISELLGEMGSSSADAVIEKLKDAVLEVIAKDTRARAAAWLELNKTPLPRAAEIVLDIEPELRLRSPRPEDGSARDWKTFTYNTFFSTHRKMTPSELQTTGHEASIADQEDAKHAADIRDKQFKDLKRQVDEAARRRAIDHPVRG